MAHQVGLKLVLTIYGFFDVVVPAILTNQLPDLSQSKPLNTLLLRYNSTVCLKTTISQRWRDTRRAVWIRFRDLKHQLIDILLRPKRPLLELPAELRELIYEAVCVQDEKGVIGVGALHLLLINKQIYREAKLIFDRIEHHVQIGDEIKFTKVQPTYWGFPQIILPPTPDDPIKWAMSNVKHLVLEVYVCNIGEMTPDRFDVILAHNAKEQWRNLKQLIGIWPEIRETPLQSVRLDFQLSKAPSDGKMYRADMIRVIRNFKRTRVWAETGDCSREKSNTSKLLPLVRAFNQGRRNWVHESDVDNNLIVNYDQHLLPRRAVQTDGKGKESFEIQFEKWSIIPKNDTSRSDNSVWPEWTGKEEKYIFDKMVVRERNDDRDWECLECLAVFDKPGDRRDHRTRGRWRSFPSQSTLLEDSSA